jgi:hypothetical protein
MIRDQLSSLIGARLKGPDAPAQIEAFSIGALSG